MYLYDFVTKFGYAVMQVLLARSTWKYFSMCEIYNNNTSIQIQNSFVQRTNDIVLFYIQQDFH